MQTKGRSKQAPTLTRVASGVMRVMQETASDVLTQRSKWVWSAATLSIWNWAFKRIRYRVSKYRARMLVARMQLDVAGTQHRLPETSGKQLSVLTTLLVTFRTMN